MLLLTKQAGHRQADLVPHQGDGKGGFPAGTGQPAAGCPPAETPSSPRSPAARQTGQRKAMDRFASSIIKATSVVFGFRGRVHYTMSLRQGTEKKSWISGLFPLLALWRQIRYTKLRGDSP